MKRLSLLVVISVAYTLIGLKFVSSFSMTKKVPVIKMARSDLVLEVNANKTIECEAKKPITWISKV